jgi:hypothetical protein
MPRLPQGIAGNAGVMSVAGELGRRGLIALPTVRNTEGVDLIVSEPMGGRSVAIQVKTSQKPAKKWVLSEKCEKCRNRSLFYVFVNLGVPGQLPCYHIVPSEVVASTMTREHAAWVKAPGKRGQPHNPNAVRVFRDEQNTYLDAWARLGLSMTE